jgi:hypothetical protein
MTKKLFYSLILSFGLISFQSCQKEVDPSIIEDQNQPQQVTGNLKAKVDGTQWVANTVSGASRMLGLISIGGKSSDKKTLAITLVDSGVHTYRLDDASFNAAAWVDSTMPNPINFTTNQGVNPSDAGGTVTITSIDQVNKKISGTFSFKMYRQLDGLQRTFTEGSFTDLTYITSLPPTSSTDTFRVKIAGTLWVPPVVVGAVAPAIPPMPPQLGITGTSTDATKSVGVIVPANITPGTYTFDFFGATYIGAYNPSTDPTQSQASMSGTLTILSHNTSTKRIRGNFNFHAEALLNPLLNTELTEGFFAVSY